LRAVEKLTPLPVGLESFEALESVESTERLSEWIANEAARANTPAGATVRPIALDSDGPRVAWRADMNASRIHLVLPLVAVAALLGLAPPFAQAAPVRGLLQLPGKVAPRPVFDAPGFWRGIANEILEPLAPHVDLRSEMVVVLEGSGLTAPAEAPRLVMQDFRFAPPVLATRAKTKVVFQNLDPVLHLLEAVADASGRPLSEKPMPVLRVDASSTAVHTFEKPGAFLVRCTECPHMVVHALVIDSGLTAVPDSTGAFKLGEAPNGSYTLRVWLRGKWIHSQPLSVKGKVVVTVPLDESSLKETFADRPGPRPAATSK
jgi:hypothetical protein